MFCACRWVPWRRPLPGIPCALHSITCINTPCGSKAPCFSPASSLFSLLPTRNLPNLGLARRRLQLFIRSAPQVPTRNRAVGAPALAMFKDRLRFWDVLAAVDDLEALAYP